MADEARNAQHNTTLAIYNELSVKLTRTTDPAQVVVLESCLDELREELGSLASPERAGNGTTMS
jgi:hypothetical protein